MTPTSYNDDIQYMEAIKLAVGGVQYRGLSVKKTLIEAVRQLKSFNTNSEDDRYLEVAALYIQAYLEMGFSYDEGAEIFDEVLNSLGTSREIKFSKKFYLTKQVRLNKSQVRRMIGRWPASPHQKMKINEVVEDIIKRVRDREKGIFYYKCEVTHDAYELVISDSEMFFHDLKNGYFYSFVE